MSLKFDANEFDSALRQFKQHKPVASSTSGSDAVRIPGELDQSEAFKVRIITARAKLKLMRDRSDALRDSLQRFRMQQNSAKRA